MAPRVFNGFMNTPILWFVSFGETVPAKYSAVGVCWGVAKMKPWDTAPSSQAEVHGNLKFRAGGLREGIWPEKG